MAAGRLGLGAGLSGPWRKQILHRDSADLASKHPFGFLPAITGTSIRPVSSVDAYDRRSTRLHSFSHAHSYSYSFGHIRYLFLA